ncbi:MAG TPA: hypothetical protein VFX07_13545 [Candidatus Udaeobacter sp.]|nr:hypothetical protein [Candidatus Udaeobacter sp.]
MKRADKDGRPQVIPNTEYGCQRHSRAGPHTGDALACNQATLGEVDVN